MCYSDKELAELRGEKIDGISCSCGDTTSKLQVHGEEVHRCATCGRTYRNYNGSWMTEKDAIEYCMVKIDTIEGFYCRKDIKETRRIADIIEAKDAVAIKATAEKLQAIKEKEEAEAKLKANEKEKEEAEAKLKAIEKEKEDSKQKPFNIHLVQVEEGHSLFASYSGEPIIFKNKGEFRAWVLSKLPEILSD